VSSRSGEACLQTAIRIFTLPTLSETLKTPMLNIPPGQLEPVKGQSA